MRAVVAGLLALVAGLLLPVSLAAAWTRADVSDVDGYVATTAPLAGDVEVRRAVGAQLADAVRQAVDRAVPSGAEPVADLVVEQAVAAALRSPLFARSWRAANRAAHPSLLAVLQGGDRAIVLDLGPVVQVVLDELATYALTGPRRVEVAVVVDPDPRLTAARQVYGTLDAIGWTGLAVCAGCAAAALALSPRRRRTTSLLAAAGTAAVGAALVALLLTGSADGAVGAVVSVVTRDLRHALMVALVVALLVGLATLVPGRQTDRRQ